MQSAQIALAVVALGTVFSTGAKADCGISSRSLAPRLAIASLPDNDPLPTLPALGPQIDSLANSAQDDQEPDGSIVGLWNTTFTSGGQIVDQGFDQWNSDGTEILNDTPPPATGNVCLGVWNKAGQTFKLKHPSWTFDAAGNLNGTAIIREKVTVDPKGQNYKGTFTVDVFDLHSTLLFHQEGNINAQRISVDF